MAGLALEVQNRLATVQEQGGLRPRIVAGSFAAAVTAFLAAPLTAPPPAPQQAQRLALVNAVIRNPEFAVTPFAWVVVSRPNLNTEADITDAFIVTTIGAQFDNIAAQLFREVVA